MREKYGVMITIVVALLALIAVILLVSFVW